MPPTEKKETAAPAPMAPLAYEPIVMPEALLQPLSVEVQRPIEKPKSLYWYGILPAPGAHEAFYPKPKVNPLTKMEYLPARRWCGLCNYQQLRMGGLSFSAWTTLRFAAGDTEEAETVIRPGSLGRWDDEQVASILQNVSRHVLRWVNDTTAHHMHLDQPYYQKDKMRDKPAADYIYIARIPNESARPAMRDFLRNPPPVLNRAKVQPAQGQMVAAAA